MTQLASKGKPPAGYDIFAKGGEMGALMRTIDWSKTAVGPVETWPQTLKTSLSILLASKHPIFMWWGPELIQFYNDAYRPIVGSQKHLKGIGQRGRECWDDIWEFIEPLIQAVMERGESTLNENSMLPLDRNGFIEECYFNYAYSPIQDESGGVAGVFAVCFETTEQVLGSRRLETLRLLSVYSVDATADEACSLGASVFEKNRLDLPFSLIYLRNAEGNLSLAGSSGFKPEEVSAQEIGNEWSTFLGEIVKFNKPKQVADLSLFFKTLPVGTWPEPITQAVVIPLKQAGLELPIGLFVSGISPRRTLDESYQNFLILAAGHISTAITNARAFESERLRVAALIEIDRSKTEFFSNVSHEFRTPLTLMLGPLQENLADLKNPLSPEHEGRDKLAYQNALRLLKLVNSLLDFSRLEAGRMRAVFCPTDLSKFTRDLVSMFRSAIEKEELKFTVNIPDLSEAVYVDREMWEKIVLNLLSNAFKFTFKGEIEVRLTKLDQKICLSVRDTGIGIAKPELSRIFERFHRIEGAQGRTHEGTGIGLAMIQELAKLHGGLISADSQMGKGSEFLVEIPLGYEHLPADQVGTGQVNSKMPTGEAFVDEALLWLPDDEVVSDSVLASDQKKFKRQRILLADDNPDMRSYLKNLLKTEWDVESVSNGEAALAVALSHPPDLILSDVMMPGMDGFEMLRRLKQNPKTAAIPVILLSARAGEESRLEGLRAGAVDYLVKPFSRKELLARVKVQIDMASLRTEAILQRQKIYNVFMQAPASVAFLKGEQLIFEIANARYLAMIDKGDSIIGKPLRQALPEIEEETYLILEKVFRTGEPFVALEHEVTLDRGEQRNVKAYFSFVIEQIRDLDGNPEGVISFSSEVTDQVSSRKELERLTSELKKAVYFRDEFMAIASHELKTPITSLKLQLQMTKRQINPELGLSPSPVKLANIFDNLLRQSDRLTKLVKDLLDVTQIQAGKLVFNFKEMNVSEVIQEIINNFSEQIEKSKSQIYVQVDSALVACWDRSRIEQVIINLISNAINYAPGQPIKIHVSTRDQNAIIIVQDFGPGIPLDRQSKIFERFERAATSDGISGLGLGLFIANTIVQGHHGTIRVESEEGSGTKFILQLPLNPTLQ